MANVRDNTGVIGSNNPRRHLSTNQFLATNKSYCLKSSPVSYIMLHAFQLCLSIYIAETLKVLLGLCGPLFRADSVHAVSENQREYVS